MTFQRFIELRDQVEKLRLEGHLSDEADQLIGVLLEELEQHFRLKFNEDG